VLLLLAAVVAFLLYRPDTAAPFEVVDFSETLPILTDGQNFDERFRGLVRYYLTHGRTAVGLSAGLAAKWTTFGWWTPGWQWTRYVVLLVVVMLTWRLLRVLGASRVGAAAGASLFVVSETAAPGWLRPAVNEPFGTLLLLSAALVACRFQAAERPAITAGLVAILVVLMILSKETLVAAVILPVALGLCRGVDGLLRWPRWSGRNGVLLTAVTVAAIAMAVPILWALTQAVPEGYTRQFGAADGVLSNAAFGVLPAIIPFAPISLRPGWVVAVADLAWFGLLVAGWRTQPDDLDRRRHARILLALGLILPLARMLVYLPWPLQYPYYSIPFLVGSCILLAFALTHLERAGGPARPFGWAAAVIVLLYAAAGSGAQASRYFGTRRLTDALVSELHSLTTSGAVDTVVIAVPRVKEQAWWGLGPTLTRFGSATSRPIPVMREQPCALARAMLGERPSRTAFAALRWQCDLSAPATRTLTFDSRFFAPEQMRWLSDTLRADVYSPTRTP
jgi:hypothetical protein